MRAFLLLLATLLEIAVFYVPALILTVALLAILWDVIRRAINLLAWTELRRPQNGKIGAAAIPAATPIYS